MKGTVILAKNAAMSGFWRACLYATDNRTVIQLLQNAIGPLWGNNILWPLILFKCARKVDGQETICNDCSDFMWLNEHKQRSRVTAKQLANCNAFCIRLSFYIHLRQSLIYNANETSESIISNKHVLVWRMKALSLTQSFKVVVTNAKKK